MGVSHSSYDLVVIGAGPAGLSAVQALAHIGLKMLVIEEGRPPRARDRESHTDTSNGVGGAGLFSDGKFSFFPSATRLWSLQPKRQIEEAYVATCTRLARYGMSTPPFPRRPQALMQASQKWVFKPYASYYLSLEQRLKLIQDLLDDSQCEFLTLAKVTKVTVSRHPVLHYNVTVQREGLTQHHIQARALVLATGRFGPIGSVSDFYPSVFRRLEVGVRIQQPSHIAFFANMPALDPKLMLLSADDSIEWRTFCACRGGETVITHTSGYWTVSGRADGPTTLHSNIGFNTRIIDANTAARLLPPLLKRLTSERVLFHVNLADFVKEESKATDHVQLALGQQLSAMLHRGLSHLLQEFPALNEGALIGPTLEGIGWYPAITHQLRLPKSACWVAGDATGLFRGLTAAMVSGYYCGISAGEYLMR